MDLSRFLEAVRQGCVDPWAVTVHWKDSPSPPPAPDYVGAANAQGAANVDAARVQARMNNPNISNPYGQRVVKWDGDQPGISEELNPVSQQIFDQQQQVRLGMSGLGNSALNTVQNVMGSRFDPSAAGVPGVQTSLQNNQQANRSLDTSGVARMPVNAGMTAQNAIMSRLEPQQNRQREQYINRLMSEGHVRGNEGFDNAMREFEQGATDQRTQAALQGLGVDMQANNQGYGQALQSGQFANQAAGQNFNQGLQAGQFGNTAQQQALAQAYQLRGQPINEISALMSGSQIQNPQFQGYQGGNVAPAPIANATAQQGAWNQGLWNSQAAQADNANKGLFSLGSAALTAFSDRRLKSNIVQIGTHPLGIGVYEYDIFGHRERGVMADEVERVMPGAVVTHQSGFKMVRYALL